MPPHLPLLLTTNFLATLGLAEAGAALLALAAVILWIVQSAGNLEKVGAWLTAGRRAREAKVAERLDALESANGQFMDKNAIQERFEGLEAKHKLVAAEVANQHNTLHEYERERERLLNELRNNYNQLRRDVNLLEPMPTRVQTVENKLDSLTQQLKELKEGQREMKQEMREDMKTNKGEILQAIKDLRN